LIVFGIIALTWKESTSDFVNISPLRYAMTQPLVLLYYLRLALWPSPLVLSYGWPLEDQWPRIVFPALAVLGMLAVMFHGIWRRKWYGFVAAWFFLILAPTSSIAPMRQAIFEHRMYLSLAAIVVLAVVGVEHAIRKACLVLSTALSVAPGRPGPRAGTGAGTAPRYSRKCAVFGGVLTLALVIVLGYLTHARNLDYHDELGIWRDNIAYQPESFVAHINLGYHLRKAGRYMEAVEHLETALEIKPNRPAAHYNLGRALRDLGRTREAIAHYRQALRGDPGMADAHYDLGNALRVLGRHAEAIEHYRQAVQLKPGNADAHNNWGVALEAAGRQQEAMTHYQQAVKIDPGLPDAHYNLGNCLVTLGRHAEAIEHYRQAVQLKPDYADAHNNWGVALHALGRIEEAIAHFEQAVRLKPDYTAARENLRAAREMMGE